MIFYLITMTVPFSIRTHSKANVFLTNLNQMFLRFSIFIKSVSVKHFTRLKDHVSFLSSFT